MVPNTVQNLRRDTLFRGLVYGTGLLGSSRWGHGPSRKRPLSRARRGVFDVADEASSLPDLPGGVVICRHPSRRSLRRNDACSAGAVTPATRRESWPVLGDDDPVRPIEQYLAYLTDVERSRTRSRRTRGYDLKDWSVFLAGRPRNLRCRLDREVSVRT